MNDKERSDGVCCWNGLRVGVKAATGVWELCVVSMEKSVVVLCWVSWLTVRRVNFSTVTRRKGNFNGMLFSLHSTAEQIAKMTC